MPPLARVSAAGATILMGFLAGLDLDRVLVAMPAWQQVGVTGWAEFSRHADLGNGLLLYPLQAIGGALLILSAIVSLHRTRTGRSAPLPILYLYAAFGLSIGGLLFTAMAAPIMLGIREQNDPAASQRAFDGFRFWGNLRGICQIAAFVSLVCGLVALPAHKPTSGSD